MAILTNADLPLILKTPSDELKKYVLSMLGYPNTDVEIDESQFEVALRTTGNWIAHYFPLEQRLAYFYTKPLISEYDMPADAYWIQEVTWDPATTSITDIFSAESYLFCFAPGIKVERDNGELVDISEWKSEYRCKTPYGPAKLDITHHPELQDVIKVTYEGGSIICTPNHLIKTNGLADMINDWENSIDLMGHTLSNGEKVLKVERLEQLSDTYTIISKKRMFLWMS